MRLLISGCLGVLTLFHGIAAVLPGEIPSASLPPAGWILDEWTDPGGWETVDVTEHGLLPNAPTQDAAPILEGIIASASTYRILHFPAGNYFFKSDLTISKNGIRIQGAGADQTNFYQQNCCFTFQPQSLENRVIPLGPPPERGDSVLHSVDADQVSVGIYVLPLAQFPWGGNREEYNLRMAKEGRGQIVVVTGVEGDSIDVSEPMGLDYTPWPDLRLKILRMLKDVGIESLHVQKLEQDKKDTLIFDQVANGYVRDVSSYYTHHKTILTKHCYRIFIEGNDIRQGWEKKKGGHAYGIQINSNTTRAYVLNNKLEQLRHAITLQQGANHCVIAYNHTKSNILLHGNYANNNLFEGNVADAGINFDAVHGSNGPFNFVFRNVSDSDFRGIGVFRGEPVIAMGNAAKKFLKVRDEDYYALNRVNGEIDPGRLDLNTELPPSLYYESAPAYLDSAHWPLYGPGAGDDWGYPRPNAASARDFRDPPSPEEDAETNPNSDS
ncbi:MAG: hypothetical protein WA771_10265 [Chthoniobacterales bacterium]